MNVNASRVLCYPHSYSNPSDLYVLLANYGEPEQTVVAQFESFAAALQASDEFWADKAAAS